MMLSTSLSARPDLIKIFLYDINYTYFILGESYNGIRVYM